MIKKVIPIVIALCFIFSIGVMAEDINAVNEETAPQVSWQIPQMPGEFSRTEQRNMGMPPMENIPDGRENMQDDGQIPGGNGQFGGQMPEGMEEFFKNMQNSNQSVQQEQPEGLWGFVKTNSTPIISVILLALAFVFVIFYRRKNY